MRRENRLQVYKQGKGWTYVFCITRNPVWRQVGCANNELITTDVKRKALKGEDLAYFENKFMNLQFRVV